MWLEVNKEIVEGLNENSPIHKVKPIQVIGGAWVVNSDLLSEPLFGFSHSYLNTCPELINVEFIIPEFP